MKAGCAFAAAACALLCGHGAALACGESLGSATRQIENAQVRVVYKSTPNPIPVGKHFSIDFAVCPLGQAAAPTELRVNASMPEHKHGMNYLPTVAARGPGLYRAEGLMFHMPGRWELVFELRGGTPAPLRLTQSLQVE